MTDATTPRPLAVVTGASSGIGYELARQFATHGYDLLIVAGDDAVGRAAEDLLATGAGVRHARADLATYDGVEAFYRTVQEQGRPVAAIALNAGRGAGGDFTRDTDLRDELTIIDLNVTSTVHLAKRVLPDMVRNGDAGVTVTSLMPGPTETEFFHRADMLDTKVGAGDKDDPAEVAAQGFEALMKGRDHVVAGSWRNKAQVAGRKGHTRHRQGRDAPEDGRTRLGRRLTAGPAGGRSLLTASDRVPAG